MNGDHKIPLLEDDNKRVNLKPWRTPEKVKETPKTLERHNLITDLIRPELLEFKNALESSEHEEAKILHDQINSLFAEGKTIEELNGWSTVTDEASLRLAATGIGWDNPEKQDKDIKSRMAWTARAQKFEVFYAGTTAFYSIYDYRDSLGTKTLIGVGSALSFQAIWIAIINYLGVNPKAIIAKYRPVIKIGNRTVIGVIVQVQEGQEFHFDIEFKINPEFDPRHPYYNTPLVRFYNRALQLRKQQLQNYKEWYYATKINQAVNVVTYNWTNIIASVGGNWGIIGFGLSFVEFPESWPSANWIVIPTAFGSFFIILKAGYTYYDEFIGKRVAEAMKRFFSTESPIYRAWKNNWHLGLDGTIACLGNAIGRALTIGAGTSAMIDLLNYFLGQIYTPLQIPYLAQLGFSIATGVVSGHGTVVSRLQMIEDYEKPFKVPGPISALDLTVATKELFAGADEEIKLSKTEKGALMTLATSYGMGMATPAFIWSYWWAQLGFGPAAGIAAFFLLLKAFSNYEGQKQHLINTKAKEVVWQPIEQERKRIKDEIKAQKSPEQKERDRIADEKAKLDKNGNPKLASGCLLVIFWVYFCVFMDQLGRALGRAGTAEAFFPDLGGAKNEVALTALSGSLQGPEARLYAHSTTDEVHDALQELRVAAGTPASEIKAMGKCKQVKYFCARNAAYMFGRAVVGKEKIQGVSDQPLGKWISGFWKYEKPEDKGMAPPPRPRPPTGPRPGSGTTTTVTVIN